MTLTLLFFILKSILVPNRFFSSH